MIQPGENNIWKAALEMSREDRVQLATLLLESLDVDDSADEQEIHQEWLTELKRRMDSSDQGIEKSIPWSEARQMIHGR
ncbi:addiction module protein [Lacunimicrobium album]